MSVRAFAAHLGVAVASVTNWERRGEHIRLRHETQQILDTDLSRAGDDVRRRFAAALGGTDPGGTVLPWTSRADRPTFALSDEVTALPAKIGRADVAQIREVADAFSTWDNARGGGLAREGAFGQLAWYSKLLQVGCPWALRVELFAAVAEFGGIAGFMAFDAYAHAAARRAFAFSLGCAEECGDVQLQASILAMQSRQATWCGRPDEGLARAERALALGSQLTATERASLHTLRARALAKLRRRQETLAAVGAADAAFSRSASAMDPPWMAFYDEAQHQGDTGHALWDLSVSGWETEAAARLGYSVDHHTAGYTRSRTISRIKLASLTMATGDPVEAAVIGAVALPDASRLRSRRAVDDLLELKSLADDRATDSRAARDLRDQISDVCATP